MYLLDICRNSLIRCCSFFQRRKRIIISNKIETIKIKKPARRIPNTIFDYIHSSTSCSLVSTFFFPDSIELLHKSCRLKFLQPNREFLVAAIKVYKESANDPRVLSIPGISVPSSVSRDSVRKKVP